MAKVKLLKPILRCDCFFFWLVYIAVWFCADVQDSELRIFSQLQAIAENKYKGTN